MYYEEKLIDGVLHWRCTPDGEWRPMSPEKLTELVIGLRKSLEFATPWGPVHNFLLPALWKPMPSNDRIHPARHGWLDEMSGSEEKRS